MANDADCENVNECPVSFSGPFSYRMCCRDEVWRFVTYGLIHASVPHIAFNAIIQLVLGVPMEMYENGPFRMAALYFCGTLAGSLGSSIFDPEVRPRCFGPCSRWHTRALVMVRSMRRVPPAGKRVRRCRKRASNPLIAACLFVPLAVLCIGRPMSWGLLVLCTRSWVPGQPISHRIGIP